MEQVYAQAAPNPEHWPVFVDKVKHALMDFEGWPPEDIQSIMAPPCSCSGTPTSSA
jgi:hypothetical protein